MNDVRTITYKNDYIFHVEFDDGDYRLTCNGTSYCAEERFYGNSEKNHQVETGWCNG